MQELTLANVNFIIDDVNKAGITFSHLRDELIDHICCDVENEMKAGSSFESAYKKIRETADNKELRKVQENTLLLIDKKYRFMKKTMKMIGWISMTMITVGALFKIQHWPGAGVLLVFGFFILGTLFFPSAVWVMRKESKIKNNLFIYIMSIIGGIFFIFGILFKIQHYPGAAWLLIIGFSSIALLLIPAILISKLRDENSKNLHLAYIIGAVSLIFYLAGDLFKIMHWPGAGICLIFGAIGLSMIFFPIYVLKVYKHAESVKAGFLFLCVGILFFNMFNLLMALNVSKDVISFFINPGKQIMNTTGILESKSNALTKEIFKDSLVKDTTYKNNIKKVKALSDELCVYIDGVKITMITDVDKVSESEAMVTVKNTTLIIAKDNYDFPTKLMVGNSQNGSIGKATELKDKISNLKTKLLEYCKSDTTATTIIHKALNTDPPELAETSGNKVSWEMNNFYHLIVISCINKLSSFQRNVRIAEFETIESLHSGYLSAMQEKQITKKSN